MRNFRIAERKILLIAASHGGKQEVDKGKNARRVSVCLHTGRSVARAEGKRHGASERRGKDGNCEIWRNRRETLRSRWLTCHPRTVSKKGWSGWRLAIVLVSVSTWALSSAYSYESQGSCGNVDRSLVSWISFSDKLPPSFNFLKLNPYHSYQSYQSSFLSI